jgi:photosystem II stability/assembly factor-like uncharacterized protein
MNTRSTGRSKRRLRVAAFIAVTAAALGIAAFFAVGSLGGQHHTVLTIKYVAPKSAPTDADQGKDADSGGAQFTVGLGGKENRTETSARDYWFFHQRAYPNKVTPSGAYAQALRQTLALNGPSAHGLLHTLSTTWAPLGPNPITPLGADANFTSGTFAGSVPYAGRVSAVAPAPSNSSVIYVGGANGGVWKSINGGSTWAPAWPTTMASFSIGSIAVNPNNASDVWVGTGEANNSGDSYFGNGLYHSTNGGTTWARVDTAHQFQGCFISSVDLVPSGTSTPTVNAAVLEFPGVPDSACTSAKRGLWHITNANTSTPTLTHESMPTSSPGCGTPCQAPNNFASVPSSPSTIFVSGYLEGIWESTNGGASWSQVINTSGYYREAVSAYSKTTIYIALSDGSGLGFGGLYKVTNAGLSTEAITTLNVGATSNSPCTYPGQGGGQCAYDLTVAADPSNASYVFVGGIRLYRFTTAGSNTGTPIGYGGGAGNIHVDQHASIFDKSGNLWEGNDGGVWALPAASVTTGVRAFVNHNGSGSSALGITELNGWITGSYTGSSSTDRLIAGTQDNGTVKYTPATGMNWKEDHGGDGGASAYINPSTYFASFYGTGVYRTTDGGGCGSTSCSAYSQVFSSTDPAEFYPPLEQDPGNLTTLYRGTDGIYRTTNATATTPTWTLISPHWSPGSGSMAPVTAIGVQKATSPAYVYAGVDATCGSTSCTAPPKLEYTHNATASTPTWAAGSGLPGRFITDIWVNPSTPSNAILTESGFNGTTSGTFGHVFKTSNGGATWVNISGNLPNVPVNAIAVDPSNPAKIFLGTDTGVFYTTTGTSSPPTWASLNGSTLPATVVMDLILQNGKLIAATHGRSVFVAPEP